MLAGIPPLCCVLVTFNPKCLECDKGLANDYIFYFSSRMILPLSFMPSFSSCFPHIKCSLTVSASKISVQDLQIPSPLCSFFWLFLCRPGGKQALPPWQRHGLPPPTHTSAIAFFIFYLVYAPLSSPLDSETPHKSDKLPWCNIKWLNFGAIVNWDFFFFFFFSFEASFSLLWSVLVTVYLLQHLYS